jgi:hypothetical protein
MVDFRVADTAPEHPKLRTAGLAAFGLWAAAGAYSMRELTDGWVPEYWVLSWAGGKKHAGTLVAVGLWFRASNDLGMPGYRFHDWEDYQRTAASVQRERAEARQRARRNRESKRSSGERSAERTANVRSESHDSRALTRALTPEGSSWEGTSRTERADSRNAPRPRCPEHAQLPSDQRIPACGACKQLRLDAEAQAADQHERETADRADRRRQIDDCQLCDDRGLREVGDALARCTHPARLEVVS